MIGKLQKTKRIFNLQHYVSGKLRGAGEDNNREWITLVACICADGKYLPPAIRLTGPDRGTGTGPDWTDL